MLLMMPLIEKRQDKSGNGQIRSIWSNLPIFTVSQPGRSTLQWGELFVLSIPAISDSTGISIVWKERKLARCNVFIVKQIYYQGANFALNVPLL
jgi:hypothetical protein